MTSRQQGGILRQAILLTVVVVVGWIVAFWPSRMWGGQSGVVWMSIAAVTCLVPGWFVVFLSGLAVFPNELAAMLVQTTVRMMSVAVVAIVVKKVFPQVGFSQFFGWLVGFYLLALVAEVWLLLGHRRATARSAHENDLP